jgi:hypothetical protein
MLHVTVESVEIKIETPRFIKGCIGQRYEKGLEFC